MFLMWIGCQTNDGDREPHRHSVRQAEQLNFVSLGQLTNDRLYKSADRTWFQFERYMRSAINDSIMIEWSYIFICELNSDARGAQIAKRIKSGKLEMIRDSLLLFHINYLATLFYVKTKPSDGKQDSIQLPIIILSSLNYVSKFLQSCEQ